MSEILHIRTDQLVGRDAPPCRETVRFFNYLTGMVVSGEEKIIKPDPRLYRVLLERFGLNPEETLFIDDNAQNIATAVMLGFKTIHYSPGVILKDELEKMGVAL